MSQAKRLLSVMRGLLVGSALILFYECNPRTATAEAPVAESVAAAADLEFFEKQVRPLLAARCYECHTGDKAKGNLQLDSRAAALRGGDTGPAVIPGNPDEGLLVDAIRYGETYQMPPKGRLAENEIAVLVDWVKRGAPWPADEKSESGKATGPAPFNYEERAKHWCFQPLSTAPVPDVQDETWPRNDVDRFVLAGLEARGLRPAPAADKHVWLRRVTFDLTGLPPTPAEIAEFIDDASPEAHEHVVDRLLTSPRYGERQARHWMDLVRFAETYGHEHDFEIPNTYPYRDYLIRAFNDDLPYDRLLVEHVAGDLLDPPRRHPTEHFNESIVGTAFFFFGEARHSPVDVREDEATRNDNQIDVFAKTFLGLTVSCARCHDHKFDCITQKDYYALVGFLQSSRYQQAFLDDPAQTGPVIDELAKLRDRERTVFDQYVSSLREPGLAQLSTTLLGSNDATAQKRIALAADQPQDVLHAWAVLQTSATTNEDDEFAKRREAVATSLADHTATPTENTTQPLADFAGSDFGDWVATGTAFGVRPGRPGDLVPADSKDTNASSPVLRPLGVSAAHSGLVADQLAGVLRSPTFTIEHPRIFYRLWGTGGKVRLILDGLQLIQNPIYGGLDFAPGNTTPHWHEQNVEKWIGHRAYIELIDDGNGWLALDQVVQAAHAPEAARPNSLVGKLVSDPAIRSVADLAIGYRQLFGDAISSWLVQSTDDTAPQCDADRIELLNEFLAIATTGGDAAMVAATSRAQTEFAEITKARGELLAKLPAPRRSLAIADGTPEDECVFIRGNHRTPGERVPRRSLQIFGGIDRPAPADHSGRLELASSLVDGSNALVPRVIVNRVWQRHFGRGIVPTPDDFGVMGQPPTNPALLDWLAAEFMRQNWSLKALDRMLVLSSTYGMSGDAAPEALAADPENHLWNHMPRRRLEAECIRDAVLAVSGRLDTTMYGPGVAPHLTPFMSGRGRPKESGPLDGAGRRSIYLNVRRNFLSPLLLAFDYPTPFTTIGRRSVSNVPAQALVLLNNPFVAEQAGLWAKRILCDEEKTDFDRVQQMYLEAFARRASDEEIAAVSAFLDSQRSLNPVNEQARVWTDLAHVLFNAKEFVFVE